MDDINIRYFFAIFICFDRVYTSTSIRENVSFCAHSHRFPTGLLVSFPRHRLRFIVIVLWYDVSGCRQASATAGARERGTTYWSPMLQLFDTCSTANAWNGHHFPRGVRCTHVVRWHSTPLQRWYYLCTLTRKAIIWSVFYLSFIFIFLRLLSTFSLCMDCVHRNKSSDTCSGRFLFFLSVDTPDIHLL